MITKHIQKWQKKYNILFNKNNPEPKVAVKKRGREQPQILQTVK